jgi:hypothetical protein
MVTDKILSVTGLSWKELVGKGFARLSQELDSDKVIFEVMEDGVRISIVCDEEERKMAANLWEENVKPEMEGDS